MKTILEFEKGAESLRVTLQADRFGMVTGQNWQGNIFFASELRRQFEQSSGTIDGMEVLGRGLALDHQVKLTLTYIDWPNRPFDDGDDFGDQN